MSPRIKFTIELELDRHLILGSVDGLHAALDDNAITAANVVSWADNDSSATFSYKVEEVNR